MQSLFNHHRSGTDSVLHASNMTACRAPSKRHFVLLTVSLLSRYMPVMSRLNISIDKGPRVTIVRWIFPIEIFRESHGVPVNLSVFKCVRRLFLYICWIVWRKWLSSFAFSTIYEVKGVGPGKWCCDHQTKASHWWPKVLWIYFSMTLVWSFREISQ